MGKVKLAVLFSILISVVIVFSILVWPSLWIQYVYECEPYTITIKVEDASGTHYYTSTGTFCGWTAYFTYDESGGGGGGGEQPPGGGGSSEQPPGDQTPNPNDANNDGFIDC